MRYLLKNKKETFELFKENVGDIIGNTSFRKCIPNYIKDPKGISDKCPLCVNLDKESKKKHQDFIKEIRREYRLDIQEIHDQKTVLIMDFKENLMLGKKRIQTSNEFMACVQYLVLKLS